MVPYTADEALYLFIETELTESIYENHNSGKKQKSRHLSYLSQIEGCKRRTSDYCSQNNEKIYRELGYDTYI
jgi:hypothetical protein